MNEQKWMNEPSVVLGRAYTQLTEYLVGQMFGHLGVALTGGWLTNLKLGHLGILIFRHLRKQP